MFDFFNQFLGGKKKEIPREPVSRLFERYLHGFITDSQLVTALGEDRIKEFCFYVAEERKNLTAPQDARAQFRLNQIDGLVEDNGLKLKRKFAQVQGSTVIERLN